MSYEIALKRMKKEFDKYEDRGHTFEEVQRKTIYQLCKEIGLVNYKG